MQMRLAIPPCHSILTPDQPIFVSTLQRQANGRVVTRQATVNSFPTKTGKCRSDVNSGCFLVHVNVIPNFQMIYIPLRPIPKEDSLCL